MNYKVCFTCSEGRHYSCINKHIVISDRQWCRCDTCAQIQKDAEDDQEIVEEEKGD